MVTNNKVAFWEYVSTDAEGNVTIKILNKDAQARLASITDEATAKVDKEIKLKAMKDASVTLEDVEAFDNLVDELVNTDAAYIVANKMTGRNIAIDWSRVSKDKQPKSKTQKDSSGATVRHEAIKVDAEFEF